jgi:hypothetical protein
MPHALTPADIQQFAAATHGFVGKDHTTRTTHITHTTHTTCKALSLICFVCCCLIWV